LIARKNKRRLGMGRAESSSNGEKEEENKAHGDGLSKSCRKFDGKVANNCEKRGFIQKGTLKC
jgi:hypothetical protein